MPNTPMVEGVMSNMKTVLEGITTDNGYWNNIRKVYRAPTEPPGAPNMPFIAMFEGQSLVNPHTNKEDLEALTVTLEVWAQAQKDRSTLVHRLRQDVETALMADTRRNGNAQSTRLVKYDVLYISDAQGSYVGLAMEFQVMILYTRGSP